MENSTLFINVLLQIITEFLPLSSSSHLVLFSKISSFSINRELVISFHIGTLLATMFHFRQDLTSLLKEVPLIFRKNTLLIHIVLATIPSVVVGFLLHKFNLEFKSNIIMGVNCIIFGFLLYVADKKGGISDNPLNKTKSILIGCGQVLAFVPGVSRLGICLTFSRMFALNKQQSVVFSFLLSIPTISGAVILTGIKQYTLGFDYWLLLKASLITTIIGILVIRFFIYYLEKHNYFIIMFYRVFIGAMLLLFF
ncbi:MAG: undecaprenyl-diphosphate phosphatase [Alphaproteobacteria bacterium]